jgi:hypothetical protein
LLLPIDLAARYPQRVSKIVVIDVALWIIDVGGQPEARRR